LYIHSPSIHHSNCHFVHIVPLSSRPPVHLSLFYLPICLFVHQFVCPSVYVYVFIYLSFRLFMYSSVHLWLVHLSICPTLYLSIWPSFNLSVHQPICALSICPPIQLSLTYSVYCLVYIYITLFTCLSICLSSYMSVCLSVQQHIEKEWVSSLQLFFLTRDQISDVSN
jgi:hypothetical protein